MTLGIKKKRLIITIGVFLLLTAGTVVAILFAKGYRPRFNNQGVTTFEGTGLLAASSYPEQSSVFIDNKLLTTTNDTINLLPGKFTVKISKEGYIPWQKELLIQKELVTLTNARLFPTTPSLVSLTSGGAKQPIHSPDGQKLAFVVTGNEISENNGIYTISTGSSPLGLDRKPQLIVRSDQTDLESLKMVWSPDSKQILIALPDKNGKAVSAAYLVESDRLTNLAGNPDVTVRLPFIFSQWETELVTRDQEYLRKLPNFMVGVATSAATNVYFSPDGEKMLYLATKELIIPEDLITPIDSINSTPQVRTIKPDQIYVYDLKEDTNYHIGSANLVDSSSPKVIAKKITVSNPAGSESTSTGQTNQNLAKFLDKDMNALETIDFFNAYYSGLKSNMPIWYSTSRHLIWTREKKITIFEYDNTNQAVVYAGPFVGNFVLPSPDGHQLLFLTNLGQANFPDNLYSLDLK